MSDTWKESGAMVYVALTVASFAAVITCCLWYSKKKRNYNPVEAVEEEVELTADSSNENADFTLEDSEEEIDLGMNVPV